ncbi:hypothetical protein HYC85_002685 [Camellia sinensis]|uniref:K Homology domain-containing protein n=1 Tax=Camellia sinensis TaxID=4442 RepID=A0A7J7IAD3_CAMSI|nr:hypothetical protein HYC85_002685 [Camellia sinensis]
MEGNRRPFFKKLPNTQFKKKGGAKRGKWSNSSREQSSGNSHTSDTVYRILCHSRKIGSVIGKGGSIVRALREETQARITVADSVPGSDEREIIIYSPATMIHRKHNSDEDEDPDTQKEDDSMEPHCPAQDALLKVHDRIVEEDLVGGREDEDGNENVVTARLLVPNNTVGCLLGKKGDVIQRLRSDTGASIRVLPAEHLPICARSTDELVQISGKPAVAKRALYEVSTLLHQNPRKDRPPLNFPMPHGGQGFHPPGPSMANLHPPGNQCGLRGTLIPVICHQCHGWEDLETSLLDLGWVVLMAVLTLSNQRSQAIDAILLLQNKTSEFSEKGIITTRLLVPSSKVGCILGQGGHVINEMRRRTQADIRVFSKEDKPKCAADHEELVQISGYFGVAKDALAEIASRLRERCLRDVNAGAEPSPVGPVKGFGRVGSLPGVGPHPSGPIRAGSSRGYEFVKGGEHDYEPRCYPDPQSPTGYPNINSGMDVKMRNNVVGSVVGTRGSNTE